ncbi:unnamed protein product [Echinostoma caproni]|uniref:ARM repeat superfamily protein n=1 Tax=Echinostoma caproni TaxID=27848 RepID=A0A183A0T8_9TREM|nr:unnamed protein product [Echinostoma caproni]
MMVSVSVIGSTSNPIVTRFYVLLRAIEKSVSYSLTHYEEMNFDGAFSLWIVKGYLKYLLSIQALWHDSNGTPLLVPVRTNLTRLFMSVEQVLPRVIQSLKQRDASYFHKMGSLFMLRWYPQSPNTLYEMGYPSADSGRDITFDEQLSDRCISQLLLTNH